jgi:hypothetical protein
MEADMKCGRCDGLMLEAHLMDMKDLSEGMWVSSWRCMNCGHAVDPVMMANRQRQALRHLQGEQIVQESLDAVTPFAA